MRRRMRRGIDNTEDKDDEEEDDEEQDDWEE
jgi:hypothetical protein